MMAHRTSPRRPRKPNRPAGGGTCSRHKAGAGKGRQGAGGDTWISSHTSTTTNADSREVVFPTTETFRIGTPVTVAAGKVVRATAATRESARVLGLVKSTSEQNVTVQIDGVFSELNGLTPGQTYFLDVDGDLTASARSALSFRRLGGLSRPIASD